jgi:flagellar hook-basal body complex protein FliE
MQVSGIQGNIPAIPSYGAGKPAPAGAGDTKGFGDMLSEVMHDLAQTEKNTNDAAARLATGEDVDVHDVVLATEMESLAFNLAMQVRNKLVEAYQEVFRMQI